MVEESFALLPFLLHDKMIVETGQRAFLALGREEGGVRSLGHLFTCCQVADIVVRVGSFNLGPYLCLGTLRTPRFGH